MGMGVFSGRAWRTERHVKAQTLRTSQNHEVVPTRTTPEVGQTNPREE